MIREQRIKRNKEIVKAFHELDLPGMRKDNIYMELAQRFGLGYEHIRNTIVATLKEPIRKRMKLTAKRNRTIFKQFSKRFTTGTKKADLFRELATEYNVSFYVVKNVVYGQ